MRIPARHAPIVFGALLSAIMVAIVTAFVLATSQGIGAGFIPDVLNLDILDDVIQVQDEDAAETTRRMAKLEGLSVRFRSKAINGPGGQQALIEDPSGNLIEIFQPREPE